MHQCGKINPAKAKVLPSSYPSQNWLSAFPWPFNGRNECWSPCVTSSLCLSVYPHFLCLLCLLFCLTWSTEGSFMLKRLCWIGEYYEFCIYISHSAYSFANGLIHILFFLNSDAVIIKHMYLLETLSPIAQRKNWWLRQYFIFIFIFLGSFILFPKVADPFHISPHGLLIKKC